MAKKKKAPKYSVYQVGGQVKINIPPYVLNPETDVPGGDLNSRERAQFQALYNQVFAPQLTPEQKQQQFIQQSIQKGVIEPPQAPEQDNYDLYGKGDPTVRPKKKLGIFDPQRTELNPFVKGFNALAYLATGIGAKVNDVKTDRNERMQYLKALQPESYENMEAYGLNGLPTFTQYGGEAYALPRPRKKGTYKYGGGLSRDDDYGSKSKPYPSVSSNDFAGGGRSYPIPTRADAEDALRLAHLHHRPDVIAKVHAKYPDLKQTGGRAPIYTEDPKDPRLLNYKDSLAAYNAGISNAKMMSTKTLPSGDVSPKEVRDYYKNYSEKNSHYYPGQGEWWNEYIPGEQTHNGYMFQIAHPKQRYDEFSKKTMPSLEFEQVKGTEYPAQFNRNGTYVNVPTGYKSFKNEDAKLIRTYGEVERTQHNNEAWKTEKDTRHDVTDLDYSKNRYLLPQYKKPVQPVLLGKSPVPPERIFNPKTARVQGPQDITENPNIQSGQYHAIDMSQKPTKYSVTYRDENSPSKQTSIYFKTKQEWQNFLKSGALNYTDTSETGDNSEAHATGYRAFQYGGDMNDMLLEMAKGGWIQGAINPAHKGYCTPMTKATCTPRRKALAMRFKHGDLHKAQTGGGGTGIPLDDYYTANAALAYYKGVLNEKLKAKNPQSFSDYFSGLGATRRAAGPDVNKNVQSYIDKAQYNEYLTPDEIKSTLGDTGYKNYMTSLGRINNYNSEKQLPPLWGEIEGSKGIQALNYGRRFASLPVTPSLSVQGYNREYKFNPQTNQVDVIESGDLTKRPRTVRPVPTITFQMGGSVPEVYGLPRPKKHLANVEAERGEVYEDNNNDIFQVNEDGNTHEQGGEYIPDVQRVLENTSNLRKDRDSKALKLMPTDTLNLVGLKTKKAMSHAEALVKANESYEDQRNKIAKNINLASKNMNKFAEKSIELNMDTLNAVPTKQQLFEALFNHQENVKAMNGIQDGITKAMGGYTCNQRNRYIPKAQTGLTAYPGNKSGLKTPAGNYDAFPSNLTLQQYLEDLTKKGFKYEGVANNKQLQTALYDYVLQHDPERIKSMWQQGMHQQGMAQAQKLGFVDEKGNFKKGVLDNPDNLKKLGDLYPDGWLGVRTLGLNPPPKVWLNEPDTGAPKLPGQKLDTSIRANIRRVPKIESKFFEPLRWYDVASPINTYLSALERLPEKYNPMEFNQLRLKQLDPTAALQQNQADYNAGVNATQNIPGAIGAQMANIANLTSRKSAADNQVLGNYENQNAQIKNNEIMYNTQVRDKQSMADQQAREVFENKVLTGKAKQQEQKLTAMDTLYKTIAENKALNRNGNLIMKFARAFDQYGEYNGYQPQFSVNPALGINSSTYFPTTSAAQKFQPAGGIQGLVDGKSYYNRRTGKTYYFNGSNLIER